MAEDVVEVVVDDLTIFLTTKINRIITNKTVANDRMNISEMIQINATITWPWSVRNNCSIEQCVTTILVFLPDQEIITTTMVILTINHVGEVAPRHVMMPRISSIAYRRSKNRRS